MSGSVNTTNTSIDPTVRIFDGFNNFELTVPNGEYDTVYGFFKTIMNTEAQAQSFTTTLFRIANITSVSVMVLLQELQGVDSIQVNAIMAYYLNGLRSPSTLLGLNKATVPNFYVARNVRA